MPDQGRRPLPEGRVVVTVTTDTGRAIDDVALVITRTTYHEGGGWHCRSKVVLRHDSHQSCCLPGYGAVPSREWTRDGWR